MRVPLMHLNMLIFVVFALSPVHSQTKSSFQISPGRLVGEVVYNELHDHERHGYWRYRTEKHTQQGTQVEEQIETVDGTVTRLVLNDGRPIGSAAQQSEANRLNRLFLSEGEQERLRKEHIEDETRIGRILALLPDAFLYEYAGEEDGRWRLRFRPNPQYPAQTVESRIFHAMSGELWIDARAKHLVRLDGQLQSNLDFGFGILGRLYKGGWFRLERVQVSDTDWKTSRLEIHMNGRAMLFKTIARETSETRGDFSPVPSRMNVRDGIGVLYSRRTEPVHGALEVSALLAARP